MKKRILSVILTFALMVCLIIPVQVQAATIKISATKKTLYVGDTCTLKITGTKKTVKWSSSKTSVATVSAKGKVKAKKAGNATITAKIGTKKKTCKITVKDRNSYTVIKDEDGNPIDLGGMEIIIRDWWTDDSKGDEASNDFARAQKEYRDWIQKTYHFTIKSKALSDWSTVFADLQDYVTAGGDENNYVFTMRLDNMLFEQMKAGLYYDVSTLNLIDMSGVKWDQTVREVGTLDGKTYLMRRQSHLPSTGIFFNKRLLKENGIDPEEIYELQRTHKWTWAKFEKYLKKLTKDTDGDGETDQWALLEANELLPSIMVASNLGCFIGRTADGKYTYELESSNTMEALEKALEWRDKYSYLREEGDEWDYYYDAFEEGKAVFLVGDEYMNYAFLNIKDDLGFVAFPMGLQTDTYVDLMKDWIHVIPSCYDKNRANKIAFAYSLYYAPVPGYETYSDYYSEAVEDHSDVTVAEETYGFMSERTAEIYGYVPGIHIWEDFLWLIGEDNPPAVQAEAIRDKWMAYIEAANK